MNREKVITRDDDYVLHTYARSPLVIERGEGLIARDAGGKAYLDFTSGIGVNSLGFAHPAWLRAVTEQAGMVQHTSNLYYTAPAAGWPSGFVPVPGSTRYFSAIRGPKRTRARSSLHANTALTTTARAAAGLSRCKIPSTAGRLPP